MRDDQAARSEALAKAAAKARDGAETIARALNLRPAGVVAAETGDVVNPQPLFRSGSMTGTVAQTVELPTPVESGTIDVTATVTVTLAVQ